MSGRFPFLESCVTDSAASPGLRWMDNSARKAVKEMVDIQFMQEERRAVALLEDQIVGYASYVDSKGDAIWILDHTYVDNNLRGQGIAAQIVDAVVDEARMQGVKIDPECPYVETLFKRKPDKYGDVWHR